MPVMVWLILSLIWSSTWLFIKLGLEDLPPITFAGIRFLIAASVLTGVVLVRGSPLPRTGRDFRLIVLTGVLAFSINYGLLFWGEERVPSNLAAILQTIIPALGLMIAHYYLPDERITVSKIAGVLLGIGGIVIIFSDQLRGRNSQAFLGSLAIVTGAFAVAYSNVLVKARARHISSDVLAAGQMVCGFIPLLLIGIPLEGNPARFHWTTLAICSLLYLAFIGSCVAFVLYYWLVARMAVTKTLLISLVTPVLASVLGDLVLGEKFTWRILLGAAVILCGIGLIVKSKWQSEYQAVTP